MITATGLTKKFQGIVALDHASLEVAPGRVAGVLGPNGAGKSTLFKILCGLLAPDQGQYRISGTGPKKAGAIIEGPALYGYLNARDNIHAFAYAQGARMSPAEIRELLEKVGLPHDRKDRVSHFSMGMKQRLGIAIALLNRPSALILDEPFSGLDPLGKQALRELIRKLAEQEKLAILVSSHLLDELEKVCQDLYVLWNGQVVAQGAVQDLLTRMVSSYRITASNLEKSDWLKENGARLEEGSALLPLSRQEVPGVLSILLAEGVEVAACVPQMDWNQFFKAPGI